MNLKTKTALFVLAVLIAMFSCNNKAVNDEENIDIPETMDTAKEEIVVEEKPIEEQAEEPPKILGRDIPGLLEHYRLLLTERYGEVDTITIEFADTFDHRYLFEITMKSTSNIVSALYRLDAEFREEENTWEANEHCYGHYYISVSQIETPCDFYHYLMNIYRIDDVYALRTHICDTGYSSYATVWMGDVDEPQHEEETLTEKDHITFDDLDFDLTYNQFRFYVYCDDEFEEDGTAVINHSGPGFQETLFLEKTKEGIFIVRHLQDDH